MPRAKRVPRDDPDSASAALVADGSEDVYGTVDDSLDETLAHQQPQDESETLLGLEPTQAARRLGERAGGGLDAIEPASEKLGWRTVFVCSFTTLGGFIFGYDTGVIGGVIEMEGFRDTMGLPRKVNGEDDNEDTANKLGWVVAILSLGCFFGAVTAGQLADRVGRKWATFWGGITATVGAVVQAAATDLVAMYAGRFVCGIGVGTLSSIVPLYNAEVAPKAVRGFLVALQQLAITFGIMVAFLANFGLEATHQGWRVSLWLQAVASGVLLIGAPCLPETPRWLASKGRTTAAVEALESVRPHLEGDKARAMIAEITKALNEEAVGADASWTGLLVWPKRYRLMLGMGIMIGSQLTGINAIIYYAPTIFSTVGIEPLVATAVVGVVNFLSTFIGLYALDRAGRKILLVFGSAGMFLSFLGIVILLATDNAGIVVVVLVTLYTACFAAGWGPTGWVYISEIFPMAGRGKAVGAASASNWAISTVLAWATPLMLREDGGLGLIGTFSFYAAFCLADGLFVLLLCAETKGKSLEEIGELFTIPLNPLAVGNYRAFFSRGNGRRRQTEVMTYQSEAFVREPTAEDSSTA